MSRIPRNPEVAVVTSSRVDFPPELENLRDLSKTGRGQQAVNAAARIYFKWLQKDFQKNSKGNRGRWKRITKAAQKSKRVARWGRKAILADTLTFYHAIQPSRTGTEGRSAQVRRLLVQKTGARIILGIGTTKIHPSTQRTKSGKRRRGFTIRQLAVIHANGLGNKHQRLPKRPIVVPPPAPVFDKMTQEFLHVLTHGRR